MFTCERCQSPKPDGVRVKIIEFNPDGNDTIVQICTTCFLTMFPGSYWLTCHDCGERFAAGSTRKVVTFIGTIGASHSVCMSCLEMNYIECTRCHSFVPRGQSWRILGDDEHGTYCPRCHAIIVAGSSMTRNPERRNTVTFKRNASTDAMINDPESEA